MGKTTIHSGKTGYVDGDYFNIKPEDLVSKTAESPVQLTETHATVEVIHPQELQAALRAIPLLSGAVVTTKSPLAPWQMLVGGAIAIYGQVQFWETEVDARGIKSAEDILELAGMIQASLDKAASSLAKGN